MKQTEKTLLEQMRVTDFEVVHRKGLFSLNDQDVLALKAAKPIIDVHIDALVDSFYGLQTAVPEIALLIGDSDTLSRLRNAQRRYVLDLFRGLYDLDYVNNRLRIGLVHKRIGVEPKLYLAAIYTLKGLLEDVLSQNLPQGEERDGVLQALEKLLFFDVTLVFDTYIRSLLSEIEISRQKSDQYARALEDEVSERTRQLELLSRTDPLTGLLNMRHLPDLLTTALRSAQRRSEPVSFIYIDIDDFKMINDTKGHRRGDEILRIVAEAISYVSRKEDSCFRYGGDEFCVILPNCVERNARDIYVDRLKEEIVTKVAGLTLSVGVVQTGPDEYAEPERLIELADRRMYAEKQANKPEERTLDSVAQ